jgi:hypothetical protein
VAKEVPDLYRDASNDEGDDSLRCGSCGFEIARRRDRIEMSGAHEHTFVNPAGAVFGIGCFREAAGCAEVGDEEATFTWFPGWSWQIAVCRRWRFRLAPDAFHGLILARLRGA